MTQQRTKMYHPIKTYTFMKNRSITKGLVGAIGLMMVSWFAMAQQPAMQYFRTYDKDAVNVYETSKNDTTPFTGFKLRIGANFTQGWQNLSHSNNARAILGGGIVETAPGSGSFVNAAGTPVPGIIPDPNVFGGYRNAAGTTLYTNSNQLYQQAGGFPLAQANFNIDVQLVDGVRVSLISYMSSHHHNEFWVKGGYFQIDKVGFLGSEFFNKLWKNLTLKVGHMEINYGDAHFRRSDGGNTIYNPFMENNIMDAFTTEIGGELYWQKNGIIAMIGMTDGEIQGSVSRPNDRSPSVYGKLGFDRQLNEDLRVRLTGSFYNTASSISNTLYGGDRTGSNYQYVMDNTSATLTTAYTSGRVNPGFRDNVTAFMINPFIKYRGLELFGTYEMANGNSALENGDVKYSNPAFTYNGDVTLFNPPKLKDREVTQTAIDLIYRFGKNEQYYVGARYNTLSGTLAFGTSSNAAANNGINQGFRQDVSIDRTAFAAGWFITKNVLFKAEYVTQNYNKYPTDNILSGGKFEGLVIQGSIGF
jgi:hypothetical protein